MREGDGAVNPRGSGRPRHSPHGTRKTIRNKRFGYKTCTKPRFYFTASSCHQFMEGGKQGLQLQTEIQQTTPNRSVELLGRELRAGTARQRRQRCTAPEPPPKPKQEWGREKAKPADPRIRVGPASFVTG